MRRRKRPRALPELGDRLARHLFGDQVSHALDADLGSVDAGAPRYVARGSLIGRAPPAASSTAATARPGRLPSPYRSTIR
jgi:hypothetical protein